MPQGLLRDRALGSCFHGNQCPSVPGEAVSAVLVQGVGRGCTLQPGMRQGRQDHSSQVKAGGRLRAQSHGHQTWLWGPESFLRLGHPAGFIECALEPPCQPEVRRPRLGPRTEAQPWPVDGGSPQPPACVMGPRPRSWGACRRQGTQARTHAGSHCHHLGLGPGTEGTLNQRFPFPHAHLEPFRRQQARVRGHQGRGGVRARSPTFLCTVPLRAALWGHQRLHGTEAQRLREARPRVQGHTASWQHNQSGWLLTTMLAADPWARPGLTLDVPS